MKIYVATKFENAPQAREVMDRLESCGHSITYDWTEHYFKGLTDQSAIFSSMEVEAANDARGVYDSDLVIFLEHPDCRGAWAEVGMALAFSVPILIIGEYQPHIFEFLRPPWPRIVRVPHVSDAFELLQNYPEAERWTVSA